MTQIVPNNIYPSQNFYNDPRTHIISESNQIRVTTEAAPPNIQPSILINISQRHTFNLTGKLHIRNMNPISRYQLYIDNYNSLEFQPPLNNIPNFWVILRIYDFILYCIQSVQYFTIFVLIFVISLISSLFESKKNKNNKSFDQTIKCLSLGFSDEKCILFIKLFLGAIFIILMVIVPGLNIAFVAILGLLTIYYFVFLIGWYIPNICKVNIFSRCIYVRKDNPLLGDFRNNFIEINSNVFNFH